MGISPKTVDQGIYGDAKRGIAPWGPPSFFNRSEACLAVEGRPPLARSAGEDREPMITPSPSTPPRDVCVTMPIMAMRVKSLRAMSRNVVDRLRALLRRRPLRNWRTT